MLYTYIILLVANVTHTKLKEHVLKYQCTPLIPNNLNIPVVIMQHEDKTRL